MPSSSPASAGRAPQPQHATQQAPGSTSPAAAPLETSRAEVTALQSGLLLVRTVHQTRPIGRVGGLSLWGVPSVA